MLSCIGYSKSKKKVSPSQAKNNGVIQVWENKKIVSTVKVGYPNSVKQF